MIYIFFNFIYFKISNYKFKWVNLNIYALENLFIVMLNDQYRNWRKITYLIIQDLDEIVTIVLLVFGIFEISYDPNIDKQLSYPITYKHLNSYWFFVIDVFYIYLAFI